ncbi:MAG: DNA-processing protein DprA [Dysgonamonadaceae bacterium]|jgi:DNA processing protein|nr:DNA-processing protein DprA [Dysgonamonadaceae bacterium]
MCQSLVYKIGLTLVKGVGDIVGKQLLQAVEDAEVLFKEKKRLLERIPGITSRILASLQDPQILIRAEQELHFIQKNNIQALFYDDDNYPKRLRECVDSPVLLYFKGNTNLNATKIISIVGTRRATDYGKESTEKIVTEMAGIYPETLIVSGLAYGIDIIAHKAALKAGLPTVAVLAHGLDRIYPPLHRNIAVSMLPNGGLLTDFMSRTNPDRQNFVKRNRIVAGIADCTLVVESAIKGGALITAEIASSYGKDVFAIPGKINSPCSQGCNKIIKGNKAALVENATDIIQALCWETKSVKTPDAIQKTLFIELTGQEQPIYNLLLQYKNGLQINLLAIQLDIPISRLSMTLFELEMKGIIKCLPGGVFKIIE